MRDFLEANPKQMSLTAIADAVSTRRRRCAWVPRATDVRGVTVTETFIDEAAPATRAFFEQLHRVRDAHKTAGNPTEGNGLDR